MISPDKFADNEQCQEHTVPTEKQLHLDFTGPESNRSLQLLAKARKRNDACDRLHVNLPRCIQEVRNVLWNNQITNTV